MSEPPNHPLKSLRKRIGWSQAELARRLGRTQQTVHDIEHGRRPMPAWYNEILARFEKVAALLDRIAAEIKEKRE